MHVFTTQAAAAAVLLLSRQSIAAPFASPIRQLGGLADSLLGRSTERETSASEVERRASSVAPVDVVQQNFPDPGLFRGSDGTWYTFATRTIGAGINIPVAKSSDWTSWTVIQSNGRNYDSLPTMPPWVASNPNAWAPSISQVNDGSYVMYFAASSSQDTSKHCVGAATSKSVTGPYTPVQQTLFCNLTAGGAIDPAGFQDSDGKRYIVYKVDGDSIGHGGTCGNTVAPIVPTPLILQQVGNDGLTFEGAPTTLLNNAGASDDGIIENPSIFKSGSTYYLTFSSGCFNGDTYTVSYATASNVHGPYTRAPAPLLKTGDYGLISPGGASVWTDGAHMVFHAGKWGNRQLYTAEITTSNTHVSLASP